MANLASLCRVNKLRISNARKRESEATIFGSSAGPSRAGQIARIESGFASGVHEESGRIGRAVGQRFRRQARMWGGRNRGPAAARTATAKRVSGYGVNWTGKVLAAERGSGTQI